MQLHVIMEPELSSVVSEARRAETLRFHGAWITETRHDPFLPIVRGIDSTTDLVLGTAIAVAFPRSPTHLAQTANDLHEWSGGRFILGLGSQVRAHVERRFSAEFEHPVERMRELIGAMRAVWASWNEGERLDFRGDFYELTLMTPYFSPPPNPHGSPPVVLAAVGHRMTELAGEVADGILTHGFSTDRYLREVMLPAMEKGLASAGREREDIDIARQTYLVTGRDEVEQAERARQVRELLAFYATTPAYRPVLELHGWESAQDELTKLARDGHTNEMADVIDDEMLDAFALVGAPDEIGGLAYDRFGDVVDRMSFRLPGDDPGVWNEVIAGFEAAASHG